MASLVISSGPSVTYQLIDNMSASADGRFYKLTHVGSPNEHGVEFGFAGIDGVGIKWLGFRGQMLAASVLYKHTTKANLLTEWKSDADALAGVLFTVAMPDISTPFQNCKLAENGLPKGPMENLLGGGYAMETTLLIKQLRTA